jgi:hypothetical protein
MSGDGEGMVRDVEDAKAMMPRGSEEDASWMGLWERNYMAKNHVRLQKYRDAVQYLLPGLFTQKDIKWEFRAPNLRNPHDTKKKTSSVVSGETHPP